MLVDRVGTSRRIIGAAVLLAAGACSFGSDTKGNPGLGPGSGDGSTEGSSSSDDDGESTIGDPLSGTEEEGEATAAVDTSGDGPGSPARLVIVPDVLDYGNIAAQSDQVLQLDVRNLGGSTALLLTEVLIPGPFGLSGGFPGTGGTCADELGPGDSCKLAVGFHPAAIGPYVSSLDLAYYDGVDLGQPRAAPSVALAGGGVGETDNLIVNPSAESSLDGWTPTGSQWEATPDDAVDGAHAFEAGNPALGTTTLVQTIALGEWEAPLSEGGLHFRFAGSAKAPQAGASYRVDLDFGTGSQSPLQGMSQAWDGVNLTGPVPLHSTAVTVTLQCASAAFQPCGARFDELSLSLVYPPPS
jgi:hypothetical protein